MTEEKDLGVIVTSTLSWDKHVHATVSKANKLLGLLKRTCPLLTNAAIRRTLYLSLVKSQLCFGTQVWSPSHSYLQGKIERVQRRATRWILQTRVGEMSYQERLVKLDLLPLVYDRELNDLTFFYKCLYGLTDLNVHSFVSFVQHGRTRQSNSCNLKTPFCKTSTFQASYFNRIVKLWNFICKSATKESFTSISTFKLFLKQALSAELKSNYNVDRPCTWSMVRSCGSTGAAPRMGPGLVRADTFG